MKLPQPTTCDGASAKPDDRFDRLRRTSVLRGEAFDRWSKSSLLIVGAGTLGRVAPEAARAGAAVKIVDPDVTQIENLGTQPGRVGVPKALSMAQRCNAILPGSAEPLMTDVRHVGVGVFAAADLIVDTTDDPSLAVFLTEVSNGTSVPLMRVAVDGSGRREFGRVLISHGGGGHACQMCPWDIGDLLKAGPRTPCPHGGNGGPPPTLTTNATALTLAGIGLLLGMRLLADQAEAVLDREVLVDLDNLQLLPQRLVRSTGCISGHQKWGLDHLDRPADQVTLAELFGHVERELGSVGEIEAFNHPLWTAARCDSCRTSRPAVGSAWVSPPSCPKCGSARRWQLGSDHRRFSFAEAAALEILETPVAALGVPESGAMLIGRAGGKLVRMVLL